MNSEVLPDGLGADPSPLEAQAVMDHLGLRRLALPIPFEEEGPVNVFVLDNPEDEGGVTLFDSGVKTPAGTEALLGGLARLGLSPEDVTRVIVSHGHLDHWGNTRLFAEAGARIHVHPADEDKVAPAPEVEAVRDLRFDALFAWLGLDEASLEVLRKGRQWLDRLSDPPPRDSLVPLRDGERFRFARGEGEVLHVPGHTQGICVLWFEDEGVMLTADHLLQHTSPNPVMEPGPEGPEGKPRALVDYLSSVARVREMPVRWVGPGHGPLFDDHVGLIDRLGGFYTRRQTRLSQALEDRGAASTVELSRALFGKVYEKATFLVLSEVLGNLEVLADQGRIALRTDADGVGRWYHPR